MIGLRAGSTGQPFSIYVHVPFCLSKCPYCSFFSIPANSKLQKKYLKALVSQIDACGVTPWCGAREVNTIFFGGGTPTTMPTADLTGLREKIQQTFSFATEELETSFEVNPATLAKPDLQVLRRAGFNRISIGVQSFCDQQLQQLGRPHTGQDAINIISHAREAGFENLNLDLMYGLPGQDSTSWQNTLNQALALYPEHLSLYELTLEEGTVFHKLAQRGQLQLPSEDEILEMMEITSETLAEGGFNRYEISNYSMPGKTCLHNLNYWRNGSYLGIGAGAVSCFSGERRRSIEDVEQFCRTINEQQKTWTETETLGREASFRETVIMGLRLIEGVSPLELKKRYGIDLVEYYGPILQRLINRKLITLKPNSLRLTQKGLPVANAIMAELV